MANEINIQACLKVQRHSPGQVWSGNLTVNQTGTKCISNVINVGTGANATLQIDGAASLGYVLVKNLDTTAWSQSNYVHVALDNGSPPVNIISKLRAGEFCLISPKDSTTVLYARAFGAGAVDVLLCAAQT